MDTTTTIRAATIDDVAAMSRTVGRAFADDPFFNWLIPAASRRAPGIEELYRRAWKATWESHRGEVLTTDRGTGVAVWHAPGAWKTPARDGLRVLWASLVTFGPRSTARIAKILGALEKHHPSEEHWYLDLLATDPAHQRRGIGAALLGPTLEQCDRDGLPAYLETQKPENVAFYRRHGFEVRQEIQLGKDGPRGWLMWRDPR
jgi:GNAT superfamily N-acetyltransferase